MGKIKFTPVSSQMYNFCLFPYSVILIFAGIEIYKNWGKKKLFSWLHAESNFYIHILSNQNFVEKI